MIDKSTVEAALKKHMEELKVTQDSAIQKQADASEELKKYKDQLAKALSVERESLSFDDEWKAASDLEHISQVLIFMLLDICNALFSENQNWKKNEKFRRMRWQLNIVTINDRKKLVMKSFSI